ncbi:hypothetical protein V8C35DRAFT_297190 [Trichoderma chlorosporum]
MQHVVARSICCVARLVWSSDGQSACNSRHDRIGNAQWHDDMAVTVISGRVRTEYIAALILMLGCVSRIGIQCCSN